MHEFMHVIKHAFVDTIKISPILLAVYFLIEFLEYKKIMQFQHSKTLKGKASPLFGSLFGSLPQCGFSVVSTDLYTKGFVSIGALLAVYIATSDEALPIMLSHKGGWGALAAIILCKIILGIAIGYLAMWLYPKVFKTKNIHANDDTNEDHDEHEHHDHDDSKEELHHEHIGCCHHDLESSKFDWLHPLLHCFKILSFILTLLPKITFESMPPKLLNLR